MRVFRVALLGLLASLAVLFAYGAGQAIEMTIPDPDRYRDSADHYYRQDAYLFGTIGALFALGALHVLARIIRGRRSWLLPLSAYALIPILLASALPYEGWIDSDGFVNSFGYLINAFLIGLAIALAWLTIGTLKQKSAGHLSGRGRTLERQASG